MSLIQIQDRLKHQVRTAALELFGVELDLLSSATPPRPELGDLAFPVSFELAKLIKQGTGTKVAPRTIAEQRIDHAQHAFVLLLYRNNFETNSEIPGHFARVTNAVLG